MKARLFVVSIPAILGLYQIFLVLLYDIPSFEKGDNSEVILYDSIGTQLYANAQATMHLAVGYSHRVGKEVKIRTLTLAYCMGVDRVHLEQMISTKGVRWRTYFARNGSQMVFKNDSKEEIKNRLYHQCYLYLLGFLPIIVLLIAEAIKELFLKMKTRYW